MIFWSFFLSGILQAAPPYELDSKYDFCIVTRKGVASGNTSPLSEKEIVLPPIEAADEGRAVERFKATLTRLRDPKGQSAAILSHAVKEYARLKSKLTAEERVEAEGVLLLNGIDLDPRSARERYSPRIENNEPGVEFIHKFGKFLTHSQSKFDNAGTLTSLSRRIEDGIVRSQEDISNDQTNWLDHGRAHGFDVGLRAVEGIKELTDLGILDSTPTRMLRSDGKVEEVTEPDAKQVLGAMAGLTHDMGMFGVGLKGEREDHWRAVGKLAFGGKIPQIETSRLLLEKAIHDMARDNNPLTRVLSALASSKEFSKMYEGKTHEEKIEILLRECLLVGYSHGQGEGFDPILGLSGLAKRRQDYLAQLAKPLSNPALGEVLPELKQFYKVDPSKAFMAWANPEFTKNLPDNHPAKILQRIFSAAEGALNYADSNRSSGEGFTFSGGGGQITRYIEPDPAQVMVTVDPKTKKETHHPVVGVIAKYDPETGKKLYLKSSGRIFRGTNVAMGRLGRDTNGESHFTFDVYRTNFRNPSATQASARDTGQVLGQKYAYDLRGFGDMFGRAGQPLPKLTVRLPLDEKAEEAPFRAEFEKNLYRSIADILIRNKQLPPEVLSKIKRDETGKVTDASAAVEYVKKDIVRYDYYDRPPLPKSTAESKLQTDIARRDAGKLKPDNVDHLRPLTNKEIDRAAALLIQSGIYGHGQFPDSVKAGDRTPSTVVGPTGKEELFHPTELLEGARYVKLKPGETLLEEGTRREMVYIVVSGSVVVKAKPGSGRTDFEIKPTQDTVAVLGETSFLTARDPGRSATVVGGGKAGETTVIAIPKETAQRYWNPAYIAVPNKPGAMPYQIGVMYPSRRETGNQR